MRNYFENVIHFLTWCVLVPLIPLGSDGCIVFCFYVVCPVCESICSHMMLFPRYLWFHLMDF